MGCGVGKFAYRRRQAHEDAGLPSSPLLRLPLPLPLLLPPPPPLLLLLPPPPLLPPLLYRWHGKGCRMPHEVLLTERSAPELASCAHCCR